MERRLAAIFAADMYAYSRLMEADEEGVLSRQKSHRRELIDLEIENNRGHIVKTTGDGLLAEFTSAQDAVRCAIAIQSKMPERERAQNEEKRIQYRIGINVGDVIFDDDDIFGDGVNVAARLEGLAEPGSICISDFVFQMVQGRLGKSFRDLGSQKVKNISRAIRVWQWSAAPVQEAEAPEVSLSQRIQFCSAPDNIQLAYASVGEGPALFKAPNWLNHIEYEWRSPVWGPALNGLAKNHKLVRFDQRGNGLSDWDVDDISFEAMISDMETVVTASGIERFALFGISQGCAMSVRYAYDHPEQVKCLVLLGGYIRGSLRRNSPEQEQLLHATETMIRQGWGSPSPAYRHFFTTCFMPDASPEQMSSFDELQRVSTTAENAARILTMNAEMDVSDLASQVSVPTLVLHCEGDQRVPMSEGRFLAANIPNARFVALPGNNHTLIDGSEAFERFFEEVDVFLAEYGS